MNSRDPVKRYDITNNTQQDSVACEPPLMRVLVPNEAIPAKNHFHRLKEVITVIHQWYIDN